MTLLYCLAQPQKKKKKQKKNFLLEMSFLTQEQPDLHPFSAQSNKKSHVLLQLNCLLTDIVNAWNAAEKQIFRGVTPPLTSALTAPFSNPLFSRFQSRIEALQYLLDQLTCEDIVVTGLLSAPFFTENMLQIVNQREESRFPREVCVRHASLLRVLMKQRQPKTMMMSLDSIQDEEEDSHFANSVRVWLPQTDTLLSKSLFALRNELHVENANELRQSMLLSLLRIAKCDARLVNIPRSSSESTIIEVSSQEETAFPSNVDFSRYWLAYWCVLCFKLQFEKDVEQRFIAVRKEQEKRIEEQVREAVDAIHEIKLDYSAAFYWCTFYEPINFQRRHVCVLIGYDSKSVTEADIFDGNSDKNVEKSVKVHVVSLHKEFKSKNLGMQLACIGARNYFAKEDGPWLRVRREEFSLKPDSNHPLSRVEKRKKRSIEHDIIVRAMEEKIDVKQEKKEDEDEEEPIPFVKKAKKIVVKKEKIEDVVKEEKKEEENNKEIEDKKEEKPTQLPRLPRFHVTLTKRGQKKPNYVETLREENENNE